MDNSNINIQDRTKYFAIKIIKFCHYLDSKPGCLRTLSRQLLRSGTAIGAMVREAQSAQSDKDFLNKLEIGLKEARETEYWLEILLESTLISQDKCQELLKEANTINRILITITQKIKLKIQNKKTANRELRTAN